MDQLDAERIVNLIEAIKAETLRIATEEPEEHRKLRTGNLDDRAGCGGQYFGTWDIAAGMLRDCSMYTLYPLLRLARSAHQSVHLPTAIDELLTPYINYLGYSGFPQLETFGNELRALSKEANATEIEAMLAAYLLYANRLYCWVYHYFPWNMGEHFKYRDLEPSELVPSSPPADIIEPSDTYIRLTWEPLGISVKAWLAVEQNPELCNDLLAALPFTVLQEHPMVTGDSIFAWAPMTSTAPVHVKEEIRKAPLGRLRFSQRTGQKIIVQYGPTKETIFAPVLGGVCEEDIGKLATVGPAAWDATYRNKNLLWLTVERC